MHSNRIARLACLLFFFGSFSTTTYSMQFLVRVFNACTQTAHKGIELAKRHPKLSAGIALCAAGAFLAQKLKHRFIRQCACYGQSLRYRLWHILGGRINPRSDDMRRAFFRNVQNNKIWLTRQMLDNGALVNDSAVTKDSTSALHEAIRFGHTRMANLLIARGADIAAQDHHNQTPLHVAAKYNQLEIARVLLTQRQELQQQQLLQAQAIDGYTPLHTAARYGRTAMAELLLDNHANIEATTELHIPTTRDTREAIRPLGQLRPVHVAAIMGRDETIQLLLARHADLNAQNERGRTPLDCARRIWQGFDNKQTINLLTPTAANK